ARAAPQPWRRAADLPLSARPQTSQSTGQPAAVLWTTHLSGEAAHENQRVAQAEVTVLSDDEVVRVDAVVSTFRSVVVVHSDPPAIHAARDVDRRVRALHGLGG